MIIVKGGHMISNILTLRWTVGILQHSIRVELWPLNAASEEAKPFVREVERIKLVTQVVTVWLTVASKTNLECGK